MKQVENSWREELVKNAMFRMDESLRMIRISLDQLPEQDLWKKPNSASNSVANLLLHLCGNITQYVISSLGGREDVRQRDIEFSESGNESASELLERLTAVIEDAKSVISNASEEEFLLVREVQGFTMSGIGVVIHAVEHLSYHTGQIAFWTKLLGDRDLGFYDGINLNTKNK